MTHAFETERLVKQFGTTTALAGVDLHARAGTVLGVLGPNGAGKTTLIRILATLLEPDAGRAVVDGLDVVHDAARVRRLIGLTGQYATVDEDLTGTENLVLLGRLLDLTTRQARHRSTELLEQVGLTDAAQRRVSTYSGGMRRRLDLAAGLVGRPRILFLDEPTTGLDPGKREDLWRVIRDLADEGRTVLLTTQYLEEADALAEQIHVLDRGRIVAGGTAEELKALVGGAVVRVLDQDGAVLEELATSGTTQDLAARLAEAAHRFPAATASIHRPTLDDVFLHLTTADPSAAAVRA